VNKLLLFLVFCSINSFAIKCGTFSNHSYFKKIPTTNLINWSSHNFTFYYTTSGTDKVEFSLVTNISKNLEFSLETETLNYKYNSPINIFENKKMPIYFQKMSYGVTGFAGEDSEKNPYIVFNSEILLITNFSSQIILSTTCAHELFHTIQFDYGWEAKWWMEGSAVWMENEVFPNADTYTLFSNRLRSFFKYPNKSLDSRTYDASIIPLYLSNKKKPKTIRKVWEKCGNKSAIKALKDKAGGWNKFWIEFAESCYSKRFAPLEMLPNITLQKIISEPTLGKVFADSSSSNGLFQYGFHYYEISNNFNGTMEIEINSLTNRLSAVCLLEKQDKTFKRKIKLNRKTIKFNVRNFKEKYLKAVLVIFFTKTKNPKSPAVYSYYVDSIKN